MKKRAKILLLSMLTLCLSVAVVTGATYALFSDKAEVNNHIKAGSLKVGLQQISFVETSLDADGKLALQPQDNTVVDLVQSASPLFDVEKAVPKSWYESTIKVTNEGTVAFDYGVKILFNTNNDATDEQKLFASQIKITISYGENTKEFMLSEAASEQNIVNVGTLLANKNETFKIKATFVDDENNNAVQLIDIKFDMQVFATQSV